MHYYMFSCFFLSMTVLVCLLGLTSPRFDDNLVQNAGMAMLAIGCGSRIPDLWGNVDLPFDWFLIHAGIGMFAIGTAFKIFMRERAARFVGYVHSIWRPAPAPQMAHATTTPRDDER